MLPLTVIAQCQHQLLTALTTTALTSSSHAPVQDISLTTLTSSTESSQHSSMLSISFEDPHQGWGTFDFYLRSHFPKVISKCRGSCVKPINWKDHCCLSHIAIVLAGIQKNKNKCQDMDQYTFISRVSVLRHMILTTTTHQVSLSSMT